MKPLGTQHIAEFTYCSEEILNNRAAMEEALRIGIEKSGLTLITTNSYQFDPIGVTVIAIIGESHVAIHTYPEARHASVDIFSCSSMSEPHMRLLDFLKGKLKPKTVRVMELLRGNPLDVADKDWVTTFSGYGFEVRYHIIREILSRKSKYQQIDIIENENFGKMLFLDKDLQIAERDAHIYNMSMVCPLVESDNRLNKVVILGGGDGGVLHELLKYNPKSVILVDIDEEVIQVSDEFLPSISNGAFNHPNVEIVIDDAYTYLTNREGFDAVIYDLTMHPEAFMRIERSKFLDDLFAMIKRSLLQGGMVTSQCCSEFDDETFQMIEKILSKHFIDIDFRKNFIPSFCENWMFASATVP